MAVAAGLFASALLAGCEANGQTSYQPSTTFVPAGTILCDGIPGGEGLHVAQSSEIQQKLCANGTSTPYPSTSGAEVSTAAGSAQGAGLATP